MGTRWKTQSLHSICYPSSTISTSTASTSTHSLPLHLTSIFGSSPLPLPLPSPPLSPPPLPSSPLGPASASASVSASTSSSAIRLDSDLFAKPHLRAPSTSRARSRLRSHSSSSISRLRLLPPDFFASYDFTPSTTVMTERPAIYVHFEFGVSWTPRQAPKNRQITYMSRGMRDRATQFPRQHPPPNTNFLAEAQPDAQPFAHTQFTNQLSQQQNIPVQFNQQSQFPRDIVAIHPPQHNPTHAYTPNQPQQSSQAPEGETLHPRRTSRTHSRGSHERGRSAPPPFSNSPWDANPGSSSMTVTANNLPRDQRPREAPEVWKALPATPNHFRLGEDGMPWSSWTFPMGYADDEDVENDESEGSRQQSNVSYRAENSAISPRRPEIHDRDRGKEREMQSLAAALVTVDNGFEDQWWYQGSRLVHVAGNILSASSSNQMQADAQSVHNDSIGWAVSNQDERRIDHDGQEGFHPAWASFQAMTPRSSTVDIVSPISDFSSPVPGYCGLHRSLTTRSDELHM